ncbi:putative transcription factor B3-Domain family [Helianthus annuus]|nr:putative transcription factor B3-Domain family [Helianthus annuus]KAJ0520210.1 putative transcription factor B3-Domain family [Helianthus annuus]KAJ0528750.1 putative transcription factor B3-Domain family [Helianthus annuus]KAJ0695670.1 putative transcription factor B3-Domain family [Helianthus annuus]
MFSCSDVVIDFFYFSFSFFMINPKFYAMADCESSSNILQEILNDFASLMLGEQPPYKESVKILDGNNIWVVMADEFRRQFYSKKFKGDPSTLYVGDRFWNVRMDGLSDSCVFTHGWSDLVNDLVLDKRSTFVFTMARYKTFEVSVFNHQTSTEIQFKRVDLVVLDDSIYGDDEYNLLIASEHKQKLSTAETDVEQGVVGDC